jgi:DNA-binding transcriptional LysR family regulator
MRPGLELNQLKYFYFTVLQGGVAQAADRLCVQQPVVSKMLKSLDEHFGEALFRKSGRRKVLTDFGQLVYRRCQVAFRELEKLDDVRALGVKLAGPLNIGCSEGVASEALALSIKDLVAKYPDLHPNVYVSTARHLVELLQQRKLELGLFFHLPDLPGSLEILKRIPVRFYLVVAKAQRGNLEVIERFVGSREIDDTSTHRFPTVERMRKDFLKTQIALSSNHLGFHKQMVTQGFGSAILPEHLIDEELKRKTLVDLYPKEKFMFDLKIVVPKAESLSRSAQAFLDHFVTERARVPARRR